MHLDDRLHRAATRGDELTYPRTVLVEHPTIGADEGAYPAWREHVQRPLEEADVQIGSVGHGLIAFSEGFGGYIIYRFEANIRRVADHEIYSATEGYQVESRI